MIFSNHLAMFGLVGSALALPRPQDPTFPTDAGCGQVNVFYTYAVHSRTSRQQRRSNIVNRGFPAYHPYVLAQGADPAEVDRTLKNGAASLVKAGYNLRRKISEATD